MKRELLLSSCAVLLALSNFQIALANGPSENSSTQKQSRTSQKEERPLSAYCRQIESKIRNTWKEIPNMQSDTKVDFVVNSKGEITSAIVSSSDRQNRAIQQQAERAIRNLKQNGAPPSVPNGANDLVLQASLSNSPSNTEIYMRDLKDGTWNAYMKGLQKSIKTAWAPPKSKNSSVLKMAFKIDSNGSVSQTRIERSSGKAAADRAAILAVAHAAPFEPLPDGAPSSIDIEFTLEYNVEKRH